MAEKKISFGFSKLKKPALLPGANTVKKPAVELIKCLEGQEIKILGPSVEAAKPLVIPKLANTMTSAAMAALKSLKNTIEGVDEAVPPPPSNGVSQPTANGNPQTLDQKAAHEILQSLQERQALDAAPDRSLVLKAKTADELPLDGAKESTMDDYEDIPIKQFGLAMLRGMGWKDEEQSKEDKLKNDGPVLRPRGMGLGADKMIKAKPLLVEPAQGEVLSIRKGAVVRLLTGKFKDNYGTIESMDDHAGRVLVKMAVGPSKEWLNEFMVQPVSREEFAKFGKVINSAKYEEYKIMQDKKLALQKVKMEQDDIPLSGDVQIIENRAHVHTISDSDSDRRDYKTAASSSSRRSRSTDRRPTKITDRSSNSRREERPASPEWGRSTKPRRSRSHEDYTSREDKQEDRHTSRRRDDNRHRNKSPKDRDSDSDESSSHRERRHKKSGKKSSKHKKKSSKSKSRRRRSRSRSSSSNDSDSDSSSVEEDQRRYKKHTKKSKRQRSRSTQRR